MKGYAKYKVMVMWLTCYHVSDNLYLEEIA